MTATVTGQVLEPLLIPARHRRRYNWGKKGLLPHPQQGHLQGMSKAWGWERDPYPHTTPSDDELPPKHADTLAQRKKQGDPSTHAPHNGGCLCRWFLTLRSMNSDYCPVQGLGEGCSRDRGHWRRPASGSGARGR